MKKVFVLAFFALFFGASVASAGTGQEGAACANNSMCDTTAGYTCDTFGTQQCRYTGIDVSNTLNGGANAGANNGTQSSLGQSISNAATENAAGNTKSSLGNSISNSMNVDTTVQPSGTQSSDSGFVPLAPIPGLTQGVVANSSGLPAFLNNLYKYAIGLAAAIAVVMIVWGGLEMSVQESVTQKLEGKQRIYNALFGLVLVLAPALVFGIINPAILDLSLNIPPLDVAWTNGTPTDSSKTAPLPAQISSDQQISLCTDDASCQAAAKTCSDNGGSSSVQCIDPSGTLHSPSVLQKSVNLVSQGITSGMTFGLMPLSPESYYGCAESNQTLRVICTGATSAVAGAQGATGGDIIDGTYVTYVRFTGSDARQRAGAFTCPYSGQTQISAYSLTNSRNQTYWYSICYTPQITYVYSNSMSHSTIIAKYSEFQTECSELDSALRAEGASSSATFQTGLNSKPVVCGPQDTVAGDTSCRQETVACVFSG